MSDIIPTSTKQSARGQNFERHSVFKFVVPAATSADDLRLTLPTRFAGKAFRVIGARLCKKTTTDPTTNVVTDVAITSMSHVESTGVVTIRPAAALDGAGGNEAWLIISDSSDT